MRAAAANLDSSIATCRRVLRIPSAKHLAGALPTAEVTSHQGRSCPCNDRPPCMAMSAQAKPA
eukprot:1673353-Alexandrium_andersonii.AAC.1